ncbi:hypothetical protein [Vibrio coralliilyticus]|uniref:hypothetical protein n=1 Tax=Vibrio coralliilyticus TaxID=190893 RepID=UPI002409ECC2|nr:hypothetical protein [Vibrio coralliilyticus]WFB49889.1 hypothetical protein P6988_23910 [Vibrio coralliilyticus]
MDYDPPLPTQNLILAEMKRNIAIIRSSLASKKSEQSNEQSNDFQVVTSKKQKHVRNTLTKFPHKAGAIIGGINTKTGLAFSRLAYSGKLTIDQKQKIKDLRKTLDINLDKHTLCVEEKIIANNDPFLKFYYACPFKIENFTLCNLPPCGYETNLGPQSGCKLLLHRQNIKYLTLEEVG